MNSLNRSINNNNDIYYDDYLETFNAHCVSDNSTQRPAPSTDSIQFGKSHLVAQSKSNDRKSIKIRMKYYSISTKHTNETNEHKFLLRIRILHYLIIRQYSLGGNQSFLFNWNEIDERSKNKKANTKWNRMRPRELRDEIIVRWIWDENITLVQIDESIAMNKSIKNELKVKQRRIKKKNKKQSKWTIEHWTNY